MNAQRTAVVLWEPGVEPGPLPEVVAVNRLKRLHGDAPVRLPVRGRPTNFWDTVTLRWQNN